MFLRSVIVGVCCCVLAFNSSTLSAEDALSPIVVNTDINDTAQNVWDVIVDFKNYDRWNTWTVRIDGEAKERVTVKAYGKSGMSLDLQVTTVQPPHTLCWTDVTWFTYLGLGGWRCRSIHPISDGTGVRLTNHFEFTGIFAWFLSQYTRDDLKAGMALENENLRDFVEKKSRDLNAEQAVGHVDL